MSNSSKTKASTNTKREEPPAEREKLAELVKDSTDKNRQFFALYLGLWVYVLLMVFATTDQMLLIPTQGIKLPLVDVTLPLLGFYWVAPLFLLAIHFNLLQNLESHHYKLMRWRDACGGEIPRKEIPAFLFDYEWLEHGSLMEWLVWFGSRVLFLHSGPFALGILLWRFTDYQNIWITTWHLVAFIADGYLVWLAETAFQKNEQPDQPQPAPPSVTGFIAGLRMAAVMFLRLLRHLRDYAIYLLKTFWRRVFTWLVLLQFVLACWFHSDSFLDIWSRIKDSPSWMIPIIVIDPNETAWLPDKNEIEMQALMAGEKEVGRWWQQHGNGLNLTGRHLRGFSAMGANLLKLKLDQGSDLQGANLSGTKLQGASLSGAQLQGAYLQGAQLRGSNLAGAKLQGADLMFVQLQGVELTRAQLQGAYLGNAKLQGAKMYAAQMQGANLSGAYLQGVYLKTASLQGADLTDAQLQGANLADAELQGADLEGAKLQGAVLGFTKLQKSLLPERTEVVYWSSPFSTKDADWKSISDMAQGIPIGKYRDAYVQSIEEAMARKELKEKDMQDVLPNHPEVIWETVVRDWDGDSQMDQESLLAAARGLKISYAIFAGEQNGKNSDAYHPEYLLKINQAFCASKRLQELCARSSK
jgi:uncharacterized protein YjbI with pentapeptide repeats